MKRSRRASSRSQTIIALTPSRLVAFFISTVVITVLITMQLTTNIPDLGPLPNITPHDASSMKTLEVFEDDHDALLWGTYRPHTYFGMRTATPNSLLVGTHVIIDTLSNFWNLNSIFLCVHIGCKDCKIVVIGVVGLIWRDGLGPLRDWVEPGKTNPSPKPKPVAVVLQHDGNDVMVSGARVFVG